MVYAMQNGRILTHAVTRQQCAQVLASMRFSGEIHPVFGTPDEHFRAAAVEALIRPDVSPLESAMSKNTSHRRATSLARLALMSALFGLLPAALADTDSQLAEKLARQHYQQGDVVDTVNDYELDGWNYIDPTHIVIHTGPSRHYLITLVNRCHDLSGAENIAFTTTARQLTKFDKLTVRGAGGIRQDCHIRQINALIRTPKSD